MDKELEKFIEQHLDNILLIKNCSDNMPSNDKREKCFDCSNKWLCAHFHEETRKAIGSYIVDYCYNLAKKSATKIIEKYKN